MTDRERKEKELELLELEEQESVGEATPDARDPRTIGNDALGDSVPVEMKLLENTLHAGGGFGMGQLAGAVGKLGVDAATLGPSGIRNALSGWFKKKAEEQMVKSVAPTGTNLEQIGEATGEGAEGVRKTGRYMLDKKVGGGYTTPEETVKQIEPLNKAAGEAIGEFRNKGDFRSLAQGVKRPSALDIEKSIIDELKDEYTLGAEAGQATELDNALNEIRKLAPVKTSTAGEEVGQAIENTGMEAKPYYFPEKMESADAYGAVRQQDEAARLLPRRRSIRAGEQTGPQSFGPGGAIPKSLNEPLPVEATPYLSDQPTFTELADTATRLNTAAKNARQLNQPSGAMTDAANVLSHKSTEGLEGFLNPAEQATFGAVREEFGMTARIQKIADRAQYRDMATGNALPVSHFGAISRGINAIAPAGVRASVADMISNALRVDPMAFGKNGPALQRAMQAGKESLGSTVYMLQQQDPEFKTKFDEIQNQ